MSIEEIISELERLVQKLRGQNASLTDGWPLDSQLLADETVLREAIALLKTHPEAQANEPLTLEELREMAHQPVWVKCKYFSGWAILYLVWPEIFVVAADGNTYFIWTNGEYNERLGAKLYCRPPKED